MAVLTVKNPTLLDWAKAYGPDGKVAKQIMMLSQENEIDIEAVYKEGNLPTGEQTTIVTGLPDVYYRQIGAGTPASKATRAQVVENAAILEARSEVDCDQAELADDLNAYRLAEAETFTEAMGQTKAETTFYGSASNPEEFVGFANRYSDLSAANAKNIIDAGGTGSDNTSIYLVGWGEKSVCYVFPKGSSAGMYHEDLGKQDAFDANNDRFRAYMDLWKHKCGLVVKDWRNAVRVCNIDVSDLEGQTGTQDPTASTTVIKTMTKAINLLPKNGGTRKAFYVNRTVANYLMIAAQDKSQSVLSIEESTTQFGGTIFTLKFLGVPVRIVDRLLNTEARVV